MAWTPAPLTDAQIGRMTPRQQRLFRVVEGYERSVRALNPHAEHSLVLPLTAVLVEQIEKALSDA